MDLKCRTRVNVDKLRYEWTIENLSFCTEETGESMKSSKFSSKTNDELQWLIELYPRGIDKETEGWLSVVLNLDAEVGTTVRTKYRFSVVNGNGNKINQEVALTNFSYYVRKGVNVNLVRLIFDESSDVIKLDLSNGYGNDFFTRMLRKSLESDGNHCVYHDKLTIVCEVFVLTGSSNISGEESNDVQVSECNIIDDLGRLLQDPQLSDVVLSTGDKDYIVHKAILAARSPVFAAMFKHKMKENISNKVEIADVEQEVLEEMLKFIYTGKVTKLEKMDDKLLVVADKYDLKRLKAMCEKSLCTNLSVENAPNVLAIADISSAEVLKAQAMIFIINHVEEVTETAGWEKMLSSHPHLVMELSRALLK